MLGAEDHSQRLLLGLPALPYSAFPPSPIGTSQNLLQEWPALDQGQYCPPLGCQVSSFPFLLLLSPSAPRGDLSSHHELCVVWNKSTAVFESLTPGVIISFGVCTSLVPAKMMGCTELGGVCLSESKSSGKGWLFHHPKVQTIKPASHGWPESGFIGATTSRTGGGILAKSPFSEGLGIETTNCSRLPHREAMISEVTKSIYLGGVGV